MKGQDSVNGHRRDHCTAEPPAPLLQYPHTTRMDLWRHSTKVPGPNGPALTQTVIEHVRHETCQEGGWVGGWHDAWMDCCLKLAAPIGLSPLTLALSLNSFPPQAAVPIGLSPLCALPLPAWPILTSLLTLPFPWAVLPTEPSDCPCFAVLCWSAQRRATALAMGHVCVWEGAMGKNNIKEGGPQGSRAPSGRLRR